MRETTVADDTHTLRGFVHRLARTVVVIGALVASGSTASGQGGSPPQTSITGKAVWQGEVTVAGRTSVEKGATLLILPGTTVRFTPGGEDAGSRSALVVRGALLAQGRPDAPIVFTTTAQPAAGQRWQGLVFEGANDRPSRLRHCRIEKAEEAIRASLSVLAIEDCELRGNGVGFSAFRQVGGGLFGTVLAQNDTGALFYQSNGFSMENCRVVENTGNGVVLNYGSSAAVRNCTVERNGSAGIACLQGSSPVLEGNRIAGHPRGVYVELKASPEIVRNDIVDNETGLWLEKLVFPVVVRNRIAGNAVGIYCNYSAYPRIHENNLVDNARFALVLGDNQSIEVEKQIPYRAQGQSFQKGPESEFLPPKTRKFTPFAGSGEAVVDARGNWWGESTSAQMRERGDEGNIDAIEDFRDKPETEYLGRSYPRDRVVFSPWEEAAVPEAGSPQARYSGVRGRVLFAGEPAAGVRVFAYRDASGDFRGEGLAFSAPTGPDGSFALNLAPGRYFLLAKRASTPFPEAEPGIGDLFGYYGGNPVLVSAGAQREANLYLVARRPIQEDAIEASETARLEGIVLGPSGPVDGAFLHVYPDATRDFRGPDLFGPQGPVLGGTGPDGSFSVDVPAGTYYLVASKRHGGAGVGPVRVGDFFGYFDGNPVRLQAGRRFTVSLQVAEKVRDTAARAPSSEGLLGIGGMIRAPDGTVPAGVYAYASDDANLMGGMMPPFRSALVGPDGVYFIDLPGPGTYYVGARSGYGGPPMPGEWFGVHGAEMPEPVTVEEGRSREAVDVVVRRME